MFDPCAEIRQPSCHILLHLFLARIMLSQKCFCRAADFFPESAAPLAFTGHILFVNPLQICLRQSLCRLSSGKDMSDHIPEHDPRDVFGKLFIVISVGTEYSSHIVLTKFCKKQLFLCEISDIQIHTVDPLIL